MKMWEAWPVYDDNPRIEILDDAGADEQEVLFDLTLSFGDEEHNIRQQERAALIVKAVNFHERLVTALTVSEKRLTYNHAMRCHAQPENCAGCTDASAIVSARALLSEISAAK